MPQNKPQEDLLAPLALRAADGDDKAMAELIATITPAAKAKAAKLNSDYSRISDEDLVQEGMIGFLEAVKRFDVSKGVPFRAYANMCIESRILSALRRYSNDRNVALTTAVSIDDNADEPSGDDPALVVVENDEAERLLQLIDDVLSDFEKQVFNHKMAGSSYSQIAKELGCSEKAVDNAIQRIRKKINHKF